MVNFTGEINMCQLRKKYTQRFDRNEIVKNMPHLLMLWEEKVSINCLPSPH